MRQYILYTTKGWKEVKESTAYEYKGYGAEVRVRILSQTLDSPNPSQASYSLPIFRVDRLLEGVSED